MSAIIKVSDEMAVVRNNAMRFLNKVICDNECVFNNRFDAAIAILRDCGTHGIVVVRDPIAVERDVDKEDNSEEAVGTAT